MIGKLSNVAYQKDAHSLLTNYGEYYVPMFHGIREASYRPIGWEVAPF